MEHKDRFGREPKVGDIFVDAANNRLYFGRVESFCKSMIKITYFYEDVEGKWTWCDAMARMFWNPRRHLILNEDMITLKMRKDLDLRRRGESESEDRPNEWI